MDLAVDAEPTVPACGRPRDDDVIAGLHVVHLFADGLDHTSALVAEHARRACRKDAGGLRQIRVAHPGRGDAHPHLVWGDRGELDVVEFERPPDLAQDRGPFGHRDILPMFEYI
jgi:hypothetical protein